MKAVHEASRATARERGAELYATGYEALAVLLQAEGRRLPKRLWEPACGTGALVLPLRNRGYKVIATDLHDWQCPDAETGQEWDILIADPPKERFDGIITNPPFSLAFEAANAMIRMSPYVALFLPLTFLESNQRNGWFTKVGLSRMHIISDRLPTLHRFGWSGNKIKTSRKAFAWYVIDRRNGVRKSSWETRQWSWKEAVKVHKIMEGDLPTATEAGEMPLFKHASAGASPASIPSPAPDQETCPPEIGPSADTSSISTASP